MFVQDGFLNLTVTKDKLTVWYRNRFQGRICKRLRPGIDSARLGIESWAS
jgi:hypothetical protein